MMKRWIILLLALLLLPCAALCEGEVVLQDENGNVRGSAYTGSFDRIVDPAQVEAIRVGGVWLELATFTLS